MGDYSEYKTSSMQNNNEVISVIYGGGTWPTRGKELR